MSIKFNFAITSPSKQALRRTANLPPRDTFTATCFYYHDGINSGTECSVITLENSVTSASTSFALQFPANSSNLVVNNYNTGTSVTVATSLSTGRWYFCFLRTGGGVVSGGVMDLTTYVLQTATNGSPGTGLTPAVIYVGSNSYDGTINGRVAGVKVWDATLTDSELLTEARSIVPSRLANINFWCPLIVPGFQCTRDYSGNGRDLTLIGSAVYEDSPPVSWNPATLTTNQLSYENYKLGPRFEYSTGITSGTNTANVKLPGFRAGETQAISLSVRGVGAISAPAGWSVINDTVNGNSRVLHISRLANFAHAGANLVTIQLPATGVEWAAHGMSFAGRIKSNTVITYSVNNTSLYSYIPSVTANVGDYVIGTISSISGPAKTYTPVLPSRLTGRNLIARYFFDEALSGNSVPIIRDYSGNEHHMDDIYLGNVLSYNTVTTGNTALRSNVLNSNFFARRTLKTTDAAYEYATNKKLTAEIVVDKNAIGSSDTSRLFVLNTDGIDYASLFGIGVDTTVYRFYHQEGGGVVSGKLYGAEHATYPRSSITSLPGDKVVMHWVFDSTTATGTGNVETIYTLASSYRRVSAGFMFALSPSGASSPSYRSLTSATINGTNPTINKPAGVVQNDVLIAIFCNNDSARDIVPPSGWANVANKISYTGNFTYPDLGIWAFRKVAGASEPASYQFTVNNFNGQVLIVAYSGASSAEPVIGGNIFVDTGTAVTGDTPIRAQPITTTAANSRIIYVAGITVDGAGGGGAFTPPAGFTERADLTINNDAKLSFSDKEQTLIGSTNGTTGAKLYVNGQEATTTKLIAGTTKDYVFNFPANMDIIAMNRGGSNIFHRNGIFSGAANPYDMANNSMDRTPVANLYYASLYADALSPEEILNNANILLRSTNSSIVEANTVTPSYDIVENVNQRTTGSLGQGSLAAVRYINNPGAITTQTITFNQKTDSYKENGVDYIARSFTTAPTQGSTVVVTVSLSKFSGSTPVAIENLEMFDNQGNHYKVFSTASADKTKAQYIFVSHNVRSSGTFTIYLRDFFDSVVKNYMSWGAASFLNVGKVGNFAFNSLRGLGANASVSITPTDGNSVIVAVASVFLGTAVNANVRTPTGLTNLHKQYISPFDFDSSYIILSNNSATRNIQWAHTPNGSGTSNVWIAQAIELRPNIAGTFDDNTGFLISNAASNFALSDGAITTAMVIEPVVERKGLYVDTSNGFVKYAQVTEKTAKTGKLVKYQAGSSNITTLASNTATGFYTITAQTPPLVFDGANLRPLDITREIIIR